MSIPTSYLHNAASQGKISSALSRSPGNLSDIVDMEYVTDMQGNPDVVVRSPTLGSNQRQAALLPDAFFLPRFVAALLL